MANDFAGLERDDPVIHNARPFFMEGAHQLGVFVIASEPGINTPADVLDLLRRLPSPIQLQPRSRDPHLVVLMDVVGTQPKLVFGYSPLTSRTSNAGDVTYDPVGDSEGIRAYLKAQGLQVVLLAAQ